MEGKKILIADDELNILKSLTLVLEEEGYQVITATDGEQAVHMALQEVPDLIILDIKMPKLSGTDVYRLLQEEEKSKNIPVIVLTATGQEFSKTEEWKLSPLEYVTKPFSPYGIVEKVNAILKKEA